MIIKTAPLGDLGANFYMLVDEASSEMLVVDPGARCDIIEKMIVDSGYTLRYIVLTHAHVDHIGALDDLKAKYDVPVVIHKDDASALNDDSLSLCSALRVPVPKTKADMEVTENDTLTLGETCIKFIHTPGYTKGSMCILAENILITGDTLFQLSVGRTDFPGGSFKELESSIIDKLYSLPKDTKVYPGHGNSTTILYESQNNPFVRGI